MRKGRSVYEPMGMDATSSAKQYGALSILVKDALPLAPGVLP